MPTPAQIAKYLIAGMRVVAPMKNSTALVNDVIVIAKPACDRSRAICSKIPFLQSVLTLLNAVMITKASSIPIATNRRGNIACTGQ